MRCGVGHLFFKLSPWRECLALVALGVSVCAGSLPCRADAPLPLVSAGHPVKWWFAFKLNGATFPGCAGSTKPACAFGGDPQTYSQPASQQYAFASSSHTALAEGVGCLGDGSVDPVGATFEEIYKGSFYFVVYNDQFKEAPDVPACPGKTGCVAPWGHSKGILVWDSQGQGLLLQVTTPSWPAAASSTHPRQADGNTLGCVNDNNLLYSQHFFALTLSQADLAVVLGALANASVVTDPSNRQIAYIGGPANIVALANTLGKKSSSTTATIKTLSSGVRVISKPSKLQVPPWQLVSSLVGGIPLRAATWWNQSRIYSTVAGATVGCWNDSLPQPGAVQIAQTGTWKGKAIGLKGGGANGNHAKIGVSTDASSHLVIFGDENQEGSLNGHCSLHQNARGGIFLVMKNKGLWTSVTALLKGTTAPTSAP